MKNCRICNKPLKKKGRTEHYGCRAVKNIYNKIKKGMVDMSSHRFKSAVKAMDNNPDLLLKQF